MRRETSPRLSQILNGMVSLKKRPRLGLCIEVRNVREAVEAMENRADIIMLDNMSPEKICDAAKVMKRQAQEIGVIVPELEISGGITSSKT